MTVAFLVAVGAAEKGNLLTNAEMRGTVPMCDWTGDEAATAFSF